MDHLQACPYCHKYDAQMDHCTVFNYTGWVNRRGGCGLFPERDMTGSPSQRKQRAGQQKQKHQDRSYHSKNDGKRKYKYNI